MTRAIKESVSQKETCQKGDQEDVRIHLTLIEMARAFAALWTGPMSGEVRAMSKHRAGTQWSEISSESEDTSREGEGRDFDETGRIK